MNTYTKSIKKIKKTKIRRILQTKDSSCSDLSAICIPRDNLTSLMNSSISNEIGFQGQLNKKDNNLNINEKQFSNSIDFSLTIDDKNGKTRKLESFENLHFEIRLKMPVIKEETIIYEATCVQYSNKQPDTSVSLGMI